MEDLEYDWGPIDDEEEEVLDYDLDEDWDVPVTAEPEKPAEDEKPAGPGVDAAPTPVEEAAVDRPEAREGGSEATAAQPEAQSVVDQTRQSGQLGGLPKAEVVPQSVQESRCHGGPTSTDSVRPSGGKSEAKPPEVSLSSNESKAKEGRAKIPIPVPTPSVLPAVMSDNKPKADTTLKPSGKGLSKADPQPPPKVEAQASFKHAPKEPVKAMGNKEPVKAMGPKERGRGLKRVPDVKAENERGPRPLKQRGTVGRAPSEPQGAPPPGADSRQGGMPMHALPMPPMLLGLGRGMPMQHGGIRPVVPGPLPQRGSQGRLPPPPPIAPTPTGPNKAPDKRPGLRLPPGNFSNLGPTLPPPPAGGPGGGSFPAGSRLPPGPIQQLLPGPPPRPPAPAPQGPTYQLQPNPQQMGGFQNIGRRMQRPQPDNMQMRSGQIGAGNMQMGGGQVGPRPAIAGGFSLETAFPPPHQGQQGGPSSGSGVQMGNFARLGEGLGRSGLPMPGHSMPPAQQDAHPSQPNAWGMPSHGQSTLHGLQGLQSGPGGKPLSIPTLAGELGYGMDLVGKGQDGGSSAFSGRREQDGTRSHMGQLRQQVVPMQGAYGGTQLQGGNMMGSQAMNLGRGQEQFPGANSRIDNNRKVADSVQGGPSLRDTVAGSQGGLPFRHRDAGVQGGASFSNKDARVQGAPAFRHKEAGGMPQPGSAASSAMMSHVGSGPINGTAITGPASTGSDQVLQDELKRRKAEAELRVMIQRQENKIKAKEREAKIKEWKQLAEAKAAELAAAPAASALPQAALEQMQAQIAALTQMIASVVPQPVKAVAEVALSDASKPAAKSLPAKASPVEDMVTELPSARAAVRRAEEPRPRAISPDVDEPVVEAKHLVNKAPSSEVPRRRVELATPEGAVPAKVAARPRSKVVEPPAADLLQGEKKGGNDIKRRHGDRGKKHSLDEEEEAGGWGTPPGDWEPKTSDLRDLINRKRGVEVGSMQADREGKRPRRKTPELYRARGAR